MGERPQTDTPVFEAVAAKHKGDPRGHRVRTYEEILAAADRVSVKAKNGGKP